MFSLGVTPGHTVSLQWFTMVKLVHSESGGPVSAETESCQDSASFFIFFFKIGLTSCTKKCEMILESSNSPLGQHFQLTNLKFTQLNDPFARSTTTRQRYLIEQNEHV